MRGVLTVILAGGKGLRLEPLTRDRAKPAVPFGGIYRIVDFTLSNCINSGLRRIFVLTQYKATADAIYQNIYSIERANPELVLTLAGDHIYKMDYMDMIRTHRERQADLTVGCIPVPLDQSMHFGVMQIDEQERVTDFVEKPPRAAPLADDPGHFLASMGIYVFNARRMYEILVQDATRTDSRHDFGTD